MIERIFGTQIIENVNCVEFTGRTLTRVEKRSLKERLFSLPWNPWKKIKEISGLRIR